MKYLIFSDLHGSAHGLQLLREAVKKENPDVLLCLGDTLFGAYDDDPHAVATFFHECGKTILSVRGNCDHAYDETVLGVGLPYEQILYAFGHRLWLRHAPFWDEFRGGDIVFYGHTHQKYIGKDRGVLTCNPGSIGKPRDGSASYAILEEGDLRLMNAEDGTLIESVTL